MFLLLGLNVTIALPLLRLVGGGTSGVSSSTTIGFSGGFCCFFSGFFSCFFSCFFSGSSVVTPPPPPPPIFSFNFSFSSCGLIFNDGPIPGLLTPNWILNLPCLWISTFPSPKFFRTIFLFNSFNGTLGTGISTINESISWNNIWLITKTFLLS